MNIFNLAATFESITSPLVFSYALQQAVSYLLCIGRIYTAFNTVPYRMKELRFRNYGTG